MLWTSQRSRGGRSGWRGNSGSENRYAVCERDSQEEPVIKSSVVTDHTFCVVSEQSEQSAKKGEDLDADDEKIGEEDSQFMKLAKKLTAKTLQRKGQCGHEQELQQILRLLAD